VRQRGFTLLETLLALFVFSLAVVALVEALHQLGNTTLHHRREATVQERLRSLLIEHTHHTGLPTTTQVLEDDVTYTARRVPLELRNREGLPLPDLFAVQATAEWREGRVLQQATAETWVYPPLFRPPGT
jgi:prepilin-type N-terminal cleavage/methylation domain-containing protein